MGRKNYGDVRGATEMGTLCQGDPVKEVVHAEEMLLREYLLPAVAGMRLAYFYLELSGIDHLVLFWSRQKLFRNA